MANTQEIRFECEIIKRLASQGKTLQEASDFLFNLSIAIKSPSYDKMNELLNQPLSDFVDLIEF